MSKIEVDKVDPQSGTALEIGTSGDTITVPTGAGLTVTDEVKTNKISPATGTAFTLGDSGDTFTVPSGATFVNSGTATGFAAISWQAVETGATFTAVAGNGYPVNTTAQACTVTLPASASVGDQIIFTDYARNWATYALTINPNSLKFQGNTTPQPVYDTAGESVHIVYMDVTNGWIPINDGAVALETMQPYSVDFLVIGGGGGGASGISSPNRRNGAGGGAGGYRNSYGSEASGGGGSSETAITDIAPGVVLTIDVGGGGAAGAGNGNNGVIGEESSIKGTGVDITSAGGGYGGRDTFAGGAGGSGGGGGAISGATAGGAGTSNQGYAGEAGSGNISGGAGGAAEAGGTDSASEGGDGLSSSITGSAVDRGGGGGSYNSGVKAGGAGGGGACGNSDTDDAVAGTANKGGGGGGAGGNEGTNPPGAAGGSGVVILRMPTASYSGTVTGAETPIVDGSDTILVFNGDGSYTT